MTATDELRALLDERGVEWEDHSDESLRHTVWNGAECWFTEFPDGWTAMGISKRCTPAQAIAATLGRGTCRDNYGGTAWVFKCDQCGCVIPWTDCFDYKTIRNGEINYCPSCGREVVDG